MILFIYVLNCRAGVSKIVYDAAIFLREKLEKLLPDFTLKLFDKLERLQIISNEDSEEKGRKRARDQQVEQSVALFEDEVTQVYFI